MNNRKFLTVISLALTVIAGAFSIRQIISVDAVMRAPAEQVAAVVVPEAVAAEKPTVLDSPARLTISNAGVDAHIIPVGLTRTNNLDVPPNFVEVGWYKYGPKPGQIGNTVLDGHVDNGGSIDGVFKHLRNLKPGDDIYVTGADGTQLHYKVTQSDVYETARFPSDVVFNQNDDQSILKIITCHGTFVPSMKTYDHRLVVTAVLAQ